MAEEKKRGNLLTFIGIAAVFMILFDENLRTGLGRGAGVVLDPLVGFDGRMPVLTIMLTGVIMSLLSTLLRHFTTDWLTVAKTQSEVRAFQKEFMAARKENNTFKLKSLEKMQPDVMKEQQAMSAKQLRQMPLTLILVIPLFAWLLEFLLALDVSHYSAPWNLRVDMFANNGIIFGSSLLPHWVLLYACLSVPLGAVVQKSMKYLSWRERWKGRHPEVHEG